MVVQPRLLVGLGVFQEFDVIAHGMILIIVIMVIEIPRPTWAAYVAEHPEAEGKLTGKDVKDAKI